MSSNGPKIFQIILIDSKCSQMVPKRFKWSQIVSNCPKLSQTFRMVPNSLKWSQMVLNSPKWSQISQMVPNDHKWSQMTPYSLKRSHLIQNCLKLSQLVPYVPFFGISWVKLYENDTVALVLISVFPQMTAPVGGQWPLGGHWQSMTPCNTGLHNDCTVDKQCHSAVSLSGPWERTLHGKFLSLG